MCRCRPSFPSAQPGDRSRPRPAACQPARATARPDGADCGHGSAANGLLGCPIAGVAAVTARACGLGWQMGEGDVEERGDRSRPRSINRAACFVRGDGVYGFNRASIVEFCGRNLPVWVGCGPWKRLEVALDRASGSPHRPHGGLEKKERKNSVTEKRNERASRHCGRTGRPQGLWRLQLQLLAPPRGGKGREAAVGRGPTKRYYLLGPMGRNERARRWPNQGARKPDRPLILSWKQMA